MIADRTATTFRQKLLLALAAVGVAAMTACSVSTPTPDAAPTESAAETSDSASSEASADTGTESESESAEPAGSLAAKEACAEFNSLFAEYAANKGTDVNAYEDVYFKADELGSQVSGNLVGLFASLGVLALDHATATENGGSPSKESRDAVSDAVLANASTCSAEGVTLRL